MIIRQTSYLKHLPWATQNSLTHKTPLTTFTRRNFSQVLSTHPRLLIPGGPTAFQHRKYFSGGSNLPPKDFDISKIESLQRLKEQRLYQDSSKHNAELASLENKAEMLEQAKPSHDQFIFFDPDIMANVPWFFSWITPYVDFVRNLLLSFTEFTGLPYWVPITMLCLTIRCSLLPLTMIQMRKISEIAKTAPVIAQVKRATDLSTLSKPNRYWRIFRAFCNLSREMKLRPMLLFSFNLIHIPILITNVWVIRTSMAEPLLRESSFLWMPSYIAIDPYFILPFLVCGTYYYNFGRFITKENKYTLMGRIRGGCQIFTILWFPVLCYWPSCITFYLLLNAGFTVFQTSLTGTMWFMRRMNPK